MAWPDANSYLNMGNYGQLGTGTYGMQAVASPEMFSQSPVPIDWTKSAMAGQTAAIPSGVAVPGATAGGAAGDGGWWNGIVGTKEAPGWGGLAIGAASGIANAWMGMQQYGLAKKSLAESQRQFNLNYEAQRSTTNTALEDRQRARIASNSGAYESVGDYMSRNGVK